jgi:hypothetical protein
MRFWIWSACLLSLGLAGCLAKPAESPAPSAAPRASQAAYPDLGMAPELANQTWLNVAAPLRLAELRGKVVLIDMWTFG